MKYFEMASNNDDSKSSITIKNFGELIGLSYFLKEWFEATQEITSESTNKASIDKIKNYYKEKYYLELNDYDFIISTCNSMTKFMAKKIDSKWLSKDIPEFVLKVLAKVLFISTVLINTHKIQIEKYRNCLANDIREHVKRCLLMLSEEEKRNLLVLKYKNEIEQLLQELNR